MARTSTTQSNKQESEAQRNSAATSAESTSLTSSSSSPLVDQSRLSAEDEQAQIKEQVDATLGNTEEEDLPGVKKGKFKTLGAYMLHDPTTGDSVTEDGDTVRISAFIQKALDEGRIEKA